MEWVLVKAKSMMLPKILVTKSSLKNKSKAIKTSKKYNKTEMERINKNKMISKWKVISKAKCTTSKRDNKTINKVNKLSRYPMNRWVKSTTKRGKKISKTSKDKLKVKETPMSILTVNKAGKIN